MMGKARFLIDVNLPKKISFWNSAEFVHQYDIDPKMSDEKIWFYAKNADLIIITKDTDFRNRILISNPPPKVIYVAFGNISIKEFRAILEEHWKQVIKLIENSKMVTLYKTHLESLK